MTDGSFPTLTSTQVLLVPREVRLRLAQLRTGVDPQLLGEDGPDRVEEPGRVPAAPDVDQRPDQPRLQGLLERDSGGDLLDQDDDVAEPGAVVGVLESLEGHRDPGARDCGEPGVAGALPGDVAQQRMPQDLEGHEVLLDGGLPVTRCEPPSPFEGGLAVVQVAADARRIEPVAGARPGDELPDAPGSQVGLEEAPHLPDQPVELVGRAGRFTRRPQEAPQLGDADHAALREHQRSDQHAGAGARGRDPSACTLDPDPAEERDVEQGAHRGSSRTTTPSLVVGGRPVDARPW